jgi:hypothetical protein
MGIKLILDWNFATPGGVTEVADALYNILKCLQRLYNILKCLQKTLQYSKVFNSFCKCFCKYFFKYF